MSSRETNGGRQDGAVFLGQEVRYAREHKGMTQQQLADEAQYERPYVTRVESGTLLASVQFVQTCDRVFGTSGFFERLREQVSERGHPGWFVPYVKLEQHATSISNYSNAYIMGLLQTPEYAAAIFRATDPRATDEQIAAWIEARLLRYGVMEGKNAPLLWIIVHEGVLRTVIGGRSVMAAQLERLCDEMASPNIVVQVLHYGAGAPASDLTFTLLSSDDGAPVLYTDTVEGGHVNDSAVIVEAAQSTYERLRAAALSPADSLSFIRSIAEEYTR